MKQKQKTIFLGKPSVVATAHTPEGMLAAKRMSQAAFDFIEVRADCMIPTIAKLSSQISAFKIPALLTVRHPAEGGAGKLSTSARAKIYREFMDQAMALDIELRSASGMKGVLEEAEDKEILRVISFHDFRKTPTLSQLKDVIQRAHGSGADIIKIATTLRDAKDLSTLLELQAEAKYPLATMGMGALGKVSRLALAAAGSRLNYGYLVTPQVEGQWQAKELVDLIGKVVPQ